jgi:hypothetical protein
MSLQGWRGLTPCALSDVVIGMIAEIKTLLIRSRTVIGKAYWRQDESKLRKSIHHKCLPEERDETALRKGIECYFSDVKRTVKIGINGIILEK